MGNKQTKTIVTRKSIWENLKPFNMTRDSFTCPIRISPNEVVIITKEAIFTYLISTDQWNKSKKLNKNIPKFQTDQITAAGFSKTTQLLSLFISSVAFEYGILKWIELDLKSGEWIKSKQTKSPLIQIPKSHTTFKIIDDQLHLIQNDHSIWNQQTQKFDKIHKFSREANSKLLYLPHKETLLLFRGNKSESVIVYEYCMENEDKTQRKWIKWSQRAPINMVSIEYMLSVRQDKYVLFITSFITSSPKILVLDTESKIYYKSRIYLPLKGFNQSGTDFDSYRDVEFLNHYYSYYAFILDDYSIWSRCLYGYIREMGDIIIVKDVIDIIIGYIMKEFIHLLNKGNGRHYRIQIQKVLDDMIRLFSQINIYHR